MAENGLRCDRFYASNPKCSPTRAGLLTGRNQSRFGLLNGQNFPESERIIAEVMSEAGYLTGHFGKWHLPSSAYDPKQQTEPASSWLRRLPLYR